MAIRFAPRAAARVYSFVDYIQLQELVEAGSPPKLAPVGESESSGAPRSPGQGHSGSGGVSQGDTCHTGRTESWTESVLESQQEKNEIF